eukprot:4490049-Amphidinium_carterae.3
MCCGRDLLVSFKFWICEETGGKIGVVSVCSFQLCSTCGSIFLAFVRARCCLFVCVAACVSCVSSGGSSSLRGFAFARFVVARVQAWGVGLGALCHNYQGNCSGYPCHGPCVC